MIRIIGGEFRRQKIDIPNSENVRPTQDRVREAVFSILNGKIENSICLDLFAGSGAYGFEAISRGAKFVDFVDKRNLCISSIISTSNRLGCQDRLSVSKKDYLLALDLFSDKQKKYDIIFLDPPYAMDVNKDLCEGFIKSGLIDESGIVVVEQEKELPEIEGYRLKKYKYSYKRVGIYRREN